MSQVRIVDRTGTVLFTLDGMRGEPADMAQRALDTLVSVAPPKRPRGLHVEVSDGGQIIRFAVTTKLVAAPEHA